jgi:sulfopyruvate decarboxylase alpha subunit
MIKASCLLDYLKSGGYKFYSGVPCSALQEMLNAIFREPQVRYVPAVRENAALGLASGAYLAGQPACIFIQNSGLGNIINTLTSFNLIYRIPVLMFITWRGFKSKDAPEHIIMGKKTISILEELEIPYRILSDRYEEDMDWAFRTLKKRLIPVGVIIKNGLIV